MQAIPTRLLVMDVIGTLLAAVGFAALFTDLSHIAPDLGDKDFAGMLAGIGCALMTFSMLKIVRILRERQTSAGQGKRR
jgi:hypothetical protein